MQVAGATYFITFRLINSLPIEALDKLAEEKEKINRLPESRKGSAHQAWFAKYDDYLDKALQENPYLQNEQIANMVAESIQFRDGKAYDLTAYCIMPNHVHLVCTPHEKSDKTYFSLTEILHSLKRFTATEANRLLQRNGGFWQDEAESERIVKYVLYNPVKANLAKEQKDWKWTYFKYDM